MFFHTRTEAKYYIQRHSEDFKKKLRIVEAKKTVLDKFGNTLIKRGYTVVMR